MKARLEVGDLATADGLRVAHIIREVDGFIAKTLCKEIALWSALEADSGRASRLAGPGDRTCVTCERRHQAMVRKAGVA